MRQGLGGTSRRIDARPGHLAERVVFLAARDRDIRIRGIVGPRPDTRDTGCKV
jgi:hypothetical protein